MAGWPRRARRPRKLRIIRSSKAILRIQSYPAGGLILVIGDVTILKYVAAFFSLTKPTIILLVLIGGVAALLIEGSLIDQPLKMGLFLPGLYLTGGSANGLNRYFERDIDAVMNRTRDRRPRPRRQSFRS